MQRIIFSIVDLCSIVGLSSFLHCNDNISDSYELIIIYIRLCMYIMICIYSHDSGAVEELILNATDQLKRQSWKYLEQQELKLCASSNTW
jgi:hypothetical protein